MPSHPDRWYRDVISERFWDVCQESPDEVDRMVDLLKAADDDRTRDFSITIRDSEGNRYLFNIHHDDVSNFTMALVRES